MKRYGNLFDKIYDMDNLLLAHKHASRGKGWYAEVKRVNGDPQVYLDLLQAWIKDLSYTTSPYTIFLKIDGIKERVIYKLPYFPDRICQWAILQVIEPILLSNFIRDTYSAIPKRGIHLCLDRMKEAMRTDPEGTQYCLKMDVKQFYPSIDHRILKKKFRKMFKDERLLYLLDDIIDSTPGDIGIPIGNYVSQYCGNFYLSSFDHWLKETEFEWKGKKVKIKYYYRYMDDMIILSDSKEFLHWLRRLIERYLKEELNLTLKENWQVFKVDERGIDFVGYRVFHDFILLRKSTCKNMKAKMRYLWNKVEAGKEFTYSDFCSFNSYLGWVLHCDHYRLYQKYLAKLEPYMKQYYYYNLLDSDVRREITLKEFMNTYSTIPKPDFWEDDYFSYVLLSQDEVLEHEGEENEFRGYKASYIQYTKEEWNNEITNEIRAKRLKELNQSLEQVRLNKIAESKALLEKYYADNPLFSIVHNPDGEYYSTTSDKQNYLMSMIALVDQSEQLGVEFTPTWNATGEACEPWTEAELRQLALQIAQFVYPAVSKQQAYEKAIRKMESVEEILALEIDYGTAQEGH